MVRISKVTNSREANFTREECDNLASVMNHSSATAERHYNYRDVTQAVINSLSSSISRDISTISLTGAEGIDKPSASNQLPTNSCSGKSLEPLSINIPDNQLGEHDSTLDDDTFESFDGNFEASPTSTPKKAKTNSTQRLQSKRKGSEVANHDETLQHLRTKKIKQSNN